jgi:excisionase family DNA binding protein
MFEALLEEADRLFPNKSLLTIEEVCQFLDCRPQTVYNWAKRADRKRQPPRLRIGKSLRFPKKEFLKWLGNEQMSSNC